MRKTLRFPNECLTSVGVLLIFLVAYLRLKAILISYICNLWFLKNIYKCVLLKASLHIKIFLSTLELTMFCKMCYLYIFIFIYIEALIIITILLIWEQKDSKGINFIAYCPISYYKAKFYYHIIKQINWFRAI